MWLNALGVLILATVVPAQDLKSVLQLHPSLSRLSGLLQQFDLFEKLNLLCDITVLAPTNEAIEELENFGFDFDTVDPIIAQALLTYHVLNGVFSEDSVCDLPQFLPTLLQPPLVTNVSGGAVVEAYLEGDDAMFESGLQKEARSIDTNIPFSSGLVHSIDSTLIFPHNISVTAAVAGATTFLENVAAANMVTTIESLADTTIFIPTNRAFEEIGSTGSKDQLASTVQYHVVPSSVMYSTGLSSTSFTTLEGANLTVTVNGDGKIFVNDAQIVTPDLLIYGGVAHVIDKVLSLNEDEIFPEKAIGINHKLSLVDGVAEPNHPARPATGYSIFYHYASQSFELTSIGTVFLLGIVLSLLTLAWCDGKFTSLIRRLRASRREGSQRADCDVLVGKDFPVHSRDISKTQNKDVT